mgnify:CR=1 FL=1
MKIRELPYRDEEWIKVYRGYRQHWVEVEYSLGDTYCVDVGALRMLLRRSGFDIIGIDRVIELIYSFYAVQIWLKERRYTTVEPSRKLMEITAPYYVDALERYDWVIGEYRVGSYGRRERV